MGLRLAQYSPPSRLTSVLGRLQTDSRYTRVGGSIEPTPVPAIPIIIGDLATKYGMTTPAGSGRHASQSYLSTAVKLAIVGKWNFAGASLEDATYSGITGTLDGDAAIVANGSGYALQVSGAGYLDLSKTGGYMAPDSDFSASCWSKITNMGETWFDILSHVSGSGKWEIFFNNTSDSFLQTVRNTSSEESYGQWVPYAANIENTWRHFVITYQAATKKSYLYLNGTLVAEAYDPIAGDLDVADSSNLRAGEGMTGLIGDIMLFDRALTEDEITNLYAHQYGPYHVTPAEIYTVTTTAASGAGSLAEGILTQERARTIIFETSGTIALTERLQTKEHNRWLTIAGETAPSPGITIRDYSLYFSSRDLFMRHVRLRPGTTSMIFALTGWTLDSGAVYSAALTAEPGKVRYNGTLLTHNDGATTGVGSNEWDWDAGTLYVNVGEDPDLGTLEYGVDKNSINNPLRFSLSSANIVIDHCSLSWGGDMNVQSEANDLTIQNCFSIEALDNPMHPEGPHSMNMYFKGHWDGSGEIAASGLRTLVYKNFIGFSEDRNPSVYEGATVAILNNLMAEVQGFGQYFDLGWLPGAMAFDGNVGMRNGGKPGAYIELAGSRVFVGVNNIYDGVVYGTHAEVWAWTVPTLGPGIVQSEVIVETPPIAVEGLEVADCTTITDGILYRSGARPYDRDLVDLRVVHQVLNELGGTIESEEDVGGWPVLAENTVSHSLPSSPYANAGNGYTNLEVWLHDFAQVLETPDSNKPQVYSPPTLTVVSFSQIDVNWGAVHNADTYEVWRSTDGVDFGVAPIASAISGTSYSDESCTDGTTYYYAIKATNANGTSGLSQPSESATTPVDSSYMLDLYPNALSAWSLRVLSTSFESANLILCRRASDDAELGFTATEITDGTLATWSQGGDVFVKTWYDQSGNGRDVTQSTNALQPQIVSSGTVMTLNGTPIVYSNGTQYFPKVAVSSVTQPISAYVVGQVDNTLGLDSPILPMRNLWKGIVVVYGGRYLFRGGVGDDGVTGIAKNTGMVSIFTHWDGTNSEIWLKSASADVSDPCNVENVSTLALGPITITDSKNFYGQMAEQVVFGISYTGERGTIESNINDHFAIWA